MPGDGDSVVVGKIGTAPYAAAVTAAFIAVFWVVLYGDGDDAIAAATRRPYE
eukprot:gene20241-31305_t